MNLNKSEKNNKYRTLAETYERMFEIPENLMHYSEKDYKEAKRKFIKFALEQNWISFLNLDF